MERISTIFTGWSDVRSTYPLGISVELADGSSAIALEYRTRDGAAIEVWGIVLSPQPPAQQAEKCVELARSLMALARAEPTVEHREAAKAAWAAAEAAHITAFGPRKVSGYASRAGLRQARERKAR